MKKSLAVSALLFPLLLASCVGDDGSPTPDVTAAPRPSVVMEVVQSASSGTALLIILGVMSVATVLAIATSFYLYGRHRRWRRILTEEGAHVLMPEEHGQYLMDLDAKVQMLSDYIVGEMMPALYRPLDDAQSKTADLQASFLTLQDSLDEKDREIRRLKSGYDLHVFRKFVSRFLRVGSALDDFLVAEEPVRKNLAETKVLLDDALEECGIEPFSPEVGADYLEADGVADDPYTVEVPTRDEANKIKRVLEHGYRMNTPQGYEVIKEAKVEITQFLEEG
jgi:molecular chaperone GrpE (heat shock protein)